MGTLVKHNLRKLRLRAVINKVCLWFYVVVSVNIPSRRIKKKRATALLFSVHHTMRNTLVYFTRFKMILIQNFTITLVLVQFLPSVNEVVERQCLHKRVSRILSLAGRHPAPLGGHTPGRQTPPPNRWLLQRAVRILLECILVLL